MAERPRSVEDLGVKIRGEISMEVSRKDSWSELQDFYRRQAGSCHRAHWF